MAENCMFCLDEVKPNEEILNPVGCSCLFKAHGSCLQSWFEQKNQYECPICHAVVNLNPLQPVHVVYIQERPSESGLVRRHRWCLGMCFVISIFWGLFVFLWTLITKNN